MIRAAALLRHPAGILKRWRSTAARDTPLERVIHRRMMTVLARIDILPDEASAEVRKAYEHMEAMALKRIPAIVAGRATLSPTWWRDVVGNFAEELEQKHGALNRIAADLARRMVNVAPDALGIDVPQGRVSTVEGWAAPREAWDPLFENWDERGRKRISALLDRHRSGDLGRDEAILRTMDELAVARHEADRMMRTGVGVAHATSANDRLVEVDEYIGGVEKQWWSALAKNTRPWHRRMHAVSVPVSEYFEVPGPSGITRMRHPLDPSAPPEQIFNCQCVELPNVGTLTVRMEQVA